ncbi:hypothetical protein ACFO4E_16655 [Nocardiopsis mangrovi]|uniref:Lipoprotein n=1 Tax=Nocardiopsis mangrovi TaxID=1179818 RepID=A0ABV9E0D2_9ACTN
MSRERGERAVRVRDAVLVLVAAGAMVSGCSGPDDGPAPEPSVSASPPPTGIPELQAAFEELSGLDVPSDAADMEAEGEVSDDGRRYAYRLRFATTRGGAEVICTADNLTALRADGPPSAERRELYGPREDDDEIASVVECRGDHPTDPVMRGVLVVFTEDGTRNDDGTPDGGDEAVVYAYANQTPG